MSLLGDREAPQRPLRQERSGEPERPFGLPAEEAGRRSAARRFIQPMGSRAGARGGRGRPGPRVVRRLRSCGRPRGAWCGVLGSIRKIEKLRFYPTRRSAAASGLEAATGPVDVWAIALLGFAVGFSVGLTGIGGGAIMTPALILVGGIPPMIAVGTDLAYGPITKAVAAAVHLRQKTVDLALVACLGVASVPAAVLGVGLIGRIRGVAGAGGADEFIRRALGVVLIVVAVSLLLRPWLRRGAAGSGDPLKRGARSRSRSPASLASS